MYVYWHNHKPESAFPLGEVLRSACGRIGGIELAVLRRESNEEFRRAVDAKSGTRLIVTHGSPPCPNDNGWVPWEKLLEDSAIETSPNLSVLFVSSAPLAARRSVVSFRGGERYLLNVPDINVAMLAPEHGESAIDRWIELLPLLIEPVKVRAFIAGGLGLTGAELAVLRGVFDDPASGDEWEALSILCQGFLAALTGRDGKPSAAADCDNRVIAALDEMGWMKLDASVREEVCTQLELTKGSATVRSPVWWAEVFERRRPAISDRSTCRAGGTNSAAVKVLLDAIWDGDRVRDEVIEPVVVAEAFLALASRSKANG